MNAQDQAYPLQPTLLERMALAGAQLAAEAEPAAVPVTKPTPLLAPGQVWKVDAACLEIVAVQPKLVHYRVVKQPGQKTFTRVLKRETFERSLQEHGANLVD